MASPRYLSLTVVEVDGSIVENREGLRAMVDADQVAGILEVLPNPIGSRCAVNLKWPADGTVENKHGEQVMRRQATYHVKESYEELAALLSAYGVLLRKDPTA